MAGLRKSGWPLFAGCGVGPFRICTFDQTRCRAWPARGAVADVAGDGNADYGWSAPNGCPVTNDEPSPTAANSEPAHCSGRTTFNSAHAETSACPPQADVLEEGGSKRAYKVAAKKPAPRCLLDWHTTWGHRRAGNDSGLFRGVGCWHAPAFGSRNGHRVGHRPTLLTQPRRAVPGSPMGLASLLCSSDPPEAVTYVGSIGRQVGK